MCAIHNRQLIDTLVLIKRFIIAENLFWNICDIARAAVHKSIVFDTVDIFDVYILSFFFAERVFKDVYILNVVMFNKDISGQKILAIRNYPIDIRERIIWNAYISYILTDIQPFNTGTAAITLNLNFYYITVLKAFKNTSLTPSSTLMSNIVTVVKRRLP